MLESSDNKLSYQGDDADGYSIYYMLVNGEPLFEAKASKDEAGNPIYTRRPGGVWAKTAMRAFLVEDDSRISAMTMKESIYGNMLFILAGFLKG